MSFAPASSNPAEATPTTVVDSTPDGHQLAELARGHGNAVRVSDGNGKIVWVGTFAGQ